MPQRPGGLQATWRQSQHFRIHGDVKLNRSDPPLRLSLNLFSEYIYFCKTLHSITSLSSFVSSLHFPLLFILPSIFSLLLLYWLLIIITDPFFLKLPSALSLLDSAQRPVDFSCEWNTHSETSVPCCWYWFLLFLWWRRSCLLLQQSDFINSDTKTEHGSI